MRGLALLSLLIGICSSSLVRGQLYTESSTLSAPNTEGSVAASGDTILVGTRGGGPSGPHQDVDAMNVQVFTRSASGWNLQQTLGVTEGDVVINGDTLIAGESVYARTGGTWTFQDNFPVAKINAAVQGDTIMVGVPWDPTQDYGFVAVYVRSGTDWNMQTTLHPSAGRVQFGASVALDGDTFVGGTNKSDGDGSAYVFVRNGTEWTEQAALNLPGAGAAMKVALAGDTAVVTDPENDRVGIFTRSGTTWTLAQTLTQAASATSAHFGETISLSGGALAVGNGAESSVYVHTPSGWVLAQTVTGSGKADVALANDGKLLVTGTASHHNGTATIYSVPAPPAPGSGWRDQDVGAVGVAGSSGDDGTTVTIRGSGTDIWNAADQFHFRSETLAGDGAIIARVTSAGNSHPWAKAGVMFRENVAPAARSVMALVTPGAHLGTAARADPGDVTALQDAGWAAAPIWLKVVRVGNVFQSYTSDDGLTWRLIGSVSVVMPAVIHVGLAVSSHDNAALDTATFTNVQIVRSAPPPPGVPPAPASIAVTASAANTLTVTWPDADATETGFEVERATGGGAFSLVGSMTADTTQYTDPGLTADTTYSYRVRAFNGAGASGYSPVGSAQATGSPAPGWTGQDIGNTGSAGSQSGTPPAVTMSAGGADIFGTADGFRALFTTASGDTTVVARVASMTNTHPWAKAGVMIRASLSPDAPNAAMLLTAANVCVFQARTSAGAATSSTSGGWFNAPYWVKLTRTGNTFRGYISADGSSWTLVGTQDVAMTGPVYVGLAGSSHNTGAATTIAFDHVTATGTSAPPPLAGPSNFHAATVTAHGAHLTWTDNSSDETGFQLWYDRNDRDAQGLHVYGTTGPNVTSLDVGLDSDTPYIFVIAALRGAEHSDSAGPIEVVTPQADDLPPYAPPHIAAYRRPANGIEISWADGSSTETGFEIERADGSGSFAVVGHTGINQTVYEDTGLVAGTTYAYRVRAFNNAGYSGYSDVVAETVVASPSAPANLVVDGPTDTTLHLSWTDTSNDEIGFGLVRAIAGAAPGTETSISLPANTAAYTDTGLMAGATYTYRIRANGTEFGSGYSNPATGTTTGGSNPPLDGWAGYDIGNTGSTGSDSGSVPTVGMNAGGADIYGTADGFHALFNTFEGDMTIVARVASLTNTNPWAKAGVMIRAGLGANAPNAAMLLTAAQVCAFQARGTAGGGTANFNGGYFNAPYWVKLTRTGNLFTGFVSPDGMAWTQVGSYSIPMPGQVYVGLAGSSHDVGAQTAIAFDHVEVTAGPPPPPPPPVTWTRVAWNTVSSSAMVHEGGDAIIVKTQGGDLWDRSDSGTFMYRPVTGDDMLRARIDALTFADSYTKAGLMFRATLDSYSSNVCVVVTPNHGVIFQARNSAGNVTTVVREVAGLQAPIRLWLARAGDQFLAAYSTDEGATWIPLGDVTVPMPADAYLGPVATSHNTGFETSAAFSNFSDD